MKANASYANDELRIEQTVEGESVTLRFLGKSILRDPSRFVMPILRSSLIDANREQKRLVMDFRDLVYLNSSTLTPVIRLLELARAKQFRVTALYRRALRWQGISFSALKIFGTQDGRIEIIGME